MQGRGQRLGQGAAQGGRELGHVLGTLHPKVKTVPDLAHPVGRLALQDARQLLPREVIGRGHHPRLRGDRTLGGAGAGDGGGGSS